MSPPHILLGILVLGLIASLPYWPFSRKWGWYPSSVIGFVLMVLVVTDVLSHVFV